MYLSLNGVPTTTPASSDVFFYRDPQGGWSLNTGSEIYDIDNTCVMLHDLLAERVFGSMNEFHSFLNFCPEFVFTAGLNSECEISKVLFKSLLDKKPENFPLYQALYLFDCRKLVSGIQECSREVIQLQGEFYNTFNLEEFFFPKIDEDDGVRYVTSPVVTRLYALLSFIYIRMYSLLDYITKLSLEIEGLKSDFSSYPKMISKNKLYGDRKNVSFNGLEGTLFEKCPLINEVEAVRNHVIHDGLLDDLPKAYRVISHGECIEKFILFPDLSEEGRFEVFNNRKLFYSRSDKINLRLPYLIKEFNVRLLKTLNVLLG